MLALSKGSRWLILVLLALLGILQYQLWFSQGGLVRIWQLQHKITAITETNMLAKEKNELIIADIHDLRKGGEAIEERARNSLGMLRKGEVFYEVVDVRDD